MSRKSNTTHRYTPNHSVRVATVNASPRAALRTAYPATLSTLVNSGTWRNYLYPDRRFFHPERAMQPLAFRPSLSARIVAREPYARARSFGGHYSFGSQSKAVLAVARPNKVGLCVRRKTRKEVIHAIGAAGGRVRKPKWTAYSNVRC